MRGNFSFFFFQNRKPPEMNKIVFYVVAFDPIKIQASQEPQNVPLNPSFVKDINVVGRKMARNGSKMFNLMTCKYKSTA